MNPPWSLPFPRALCLLLLARFASHSHPSSGGLEQVPTTRGESELDGGIPVPPDWRLGGSFTQLP